jgi:ABC-2 type transport system permease protein
MIIHLARKELNTIFASPLGWVTLALIQAVFGTYFYNSLNDYFALAATGMRGEHVGVTQFVGSRVFGAAFFVMLFAVPLLSMRLISEERRNLTLPFLLSAPLSLSEIVLGKYTSLLAYFSILLLLLAAMLLSLNAWSEIDMGFIVANLCGLWLLLASFSALGLYFSSLTAQPIVAAFFSFMALFSLLVYDQFLPAAAGSMLQYLSLMHHFQSFAKGLIDSADIAYFLLFSLTFLILTVRRLDADRLRH